MDKSQFPLYERVCVQFNPKEKFHEIYNQKIGLKLKILKSLKDVDPWGKGQGFLVELDCDGKNEKIVFRDRIRDSAMIKSKYGDMFIIKFFNPRVEKDGSGVAEFVLSPAEFGMLNHTHP